MTSQLLLAGVWSFVIAASLMLPIMRLCTHFGWVDRPDLRKHHVGAVPLAGGLSIVVAVAITGFMFNLPGYGGGLIVAALLVFCIGFYDDKYPLRARYRFGCHLAAATSIALIDHTYVWHLGYAIGPVPVALGWFTVPFTIVAIAGVINAFNMVDGVDGLAGGQGLMSLLWLCVAATAVPLAGLNGSAIQEIGPVLIPLAGAIIAFLAFNMRTPWRERASVFMGDGGSMMLGLVIAWASIRLANHYSVAGVGAATVVWIIAVPLFDMFSCIIRRMLEGKTPMSADRKHMHHLLMARGMSAGGAVLTMNVAAFLCGFVGVAGWLAEIPQYWLLWPLVAMFAAYLVFVRRFWREHDLLQPAAAKLRTT